MDIYFCPFFNLKKKFIKKGSGSFLLFGEMGTDGWVFLYKKSKTSSKNANWVFIRKKMDFGFFEDLLLFFAFFAFFCFFYLFFYLYLNLIYLLFSRFSKKTSVFAACSVRRFEKNERCEHKRATEKKRELLAGCQ